MKTSIIFFMGLSEKDDGVLNGTTRLSLKAEEQFGGDPRVSVYYARSWKSDVKALIAQIANRKFKRVIIVGYSWGFGRAAILAAKLAEHYGLVVPLMVSIDGVYRLPLPTWVGPNPLMVGSLCKHKQIVIPENVQRVAGVYQRLTLPQGHECVAEFLASTKIEPFRRLFNSHITIDDSEECHNFVLTEIAKDIPK